MAGSLFVLSHWPNVVRQASVFPRTAIPAMAAGAIHVLGVTSLTYLGHVIYVQIDLDHAHGTDLHPTHDLPLVIVLLHVNDVHVLAIDRLVLHVHVDLDLDLNLRTDVGQCHARVLRTSSA